ncbi:hypothetical protein ACTXT7_016037 [Hymenolepis weldensis]
MYPITSLFIYSERIDRLLSLQQNNYFTALENVLIVGAKISSLIDDGSDQHGEIWKLKQSETHGSATKKITWNRVVMLDIILSTGVIMPALAPKS